MVLAALFVLTLIPFWYTQLLPRPYLEILSSPTVEPEYASEAYRNLRSFPGHADVADRLFRAFLTQRALAASDENEIAVIANLAAELPNVERLPERLLAEFWDRKARAAKREERRDDALIAALESLVLATQQRRQQAANLVADDYPLLIGSLPVLGGLRTVFDPVSMLLTAVDGARIAQWSLATPVFQRREDWSITALEFTPLLRRVDVDRDGVVNRIGLTLHISHARMSDLRIKIIAPSGRAVEIETGVERASSSDEIRIASRQLRELVGETLSGTWSISVRDENLGVAGQFVGWNLTLNAQGNIEDFQRGLNIPEPVERESDHIWLDQSGRYAVARSMQSDSARIWDLVFAEPVRAVTINESETLIGFDPGARRLVTASQEDINIWDTASGDKIGSLPVGSASASAALTGDGSSLFVARRSDTDTSLEVWSLEQRRLQAKVVVAGVPSMVAIDSTGNVVAVADYDRAVRIWDVSSGEIRAQFDLPAQPSAIYLAAGGAALGVVHGDAGISLWNIDRPQQSLLEEFGSGRWHLVFSPSGSRVIAGRPDIGFQMYDSSDGRLIGQPVGVRQDRFSPDLLAYSGDEQLLITGPVGGTLRIWRAPTAIDNTEAAQISEHQIWKPSADRVVTATPDAKLLLIGDPAGHVHVIPAGASLEDIKAINEDVSFIGHNADVRVLSVDGSGTLAASAASDNSIRIWSTESGEPMPYIAEVSGDAVTRMVFSPDSATLGVLNNDRVWLLSVGSGDLIAQFELGEPHAGIAFATEDQLYVGGESGSLRLINRSADGKWNSQEIWDAGSPIRWVEASPRGDYLVFVDANNVARQFVLAEGALAESVLELPSPVIDVTFTGNRVLFRTSRWVHRASSARAGLFWQDSVFGPKALHGARTVFSRAADDRQSGSGVYVPALRDGFVELVELGFRGSSNPGLFGTREQLLSEWRPRLQGAPVLPAP
jgi:WD40 repeat protein